MKIFNTHYHTIWPDGNNPTQVKVIDQRCLPWKLEIINLSDVEDVFNAIKDMAVRGAPLIGVTAAFGMYLSVLQHKDKAFIKPWLEKDAQRIASARPTASNLMHAINTMMQKLDFNFGYESLITQALKLAIQYKQQEIFICENIGKFGSGIIKAIYEKKRSTVNILTHCNAGWLACIDFGTATAPIYKAFEEKVPIHVWVDETRPRNQGARLTAFELEQQGVPFTLIPDNTGGHLMLHQMVDMVIVGTDRVAANGDIANKIGTYLKALAAKDNHVPFYVAAPSSSIDWSVKNGLTEIPIEQRCANEVKYIEGWYNKQIIEMLITTENCNVANYSFDVTPARLITGIITERGICEASEKGLKSMFPEQT